MKSLASQLKMDIHIATMEARHTYTTQVTRTMGLEFAQEALGHTTMNTTQNYWKGFASESKRQVANKLMDFMKPERPRRKSKVLNEGKIYFCWTAKGYNDFS